MFRGILTIDVGGVGFRACFFYSPGKLWFRWVFFSTRWSSGEPFIIFQGIYSISKKQTSLMTRVCNAYPLFGGLSNITFRLKMIGCLHPFCWCLTRTYSKPWWLASTIDDSWPFRACFQGICATRPNWGPFKTLKSISLTEMLHSSGRKNCWTFRSSKYIGSTILGAQTQGKLFVKMTFLLVLAWNIPILTKDSVGIACLKVPGMYTVHIYIHITWIYIYIYVYLDVHIHFHIFICMQQI